MEGDRRSTVLVGALVIFGSIAVLILARLMSPAQTTPSADKVTSAGTGGDANVDVYVYDIAAGTDRRLTGDPRPDVDPEWSSDGTRIAFARFAGEDLHDLYVMNSDGSDERLLVGGVTDDFWPTWSPDGREIAFMSDRSSFGDLFAVDVATGEIRVKRTSLSPTADEFPAWSPTGNSIAFVATERSTHKTVIYTVAPDGSEKKVLRVFNRCCRWVRHIEWSPDGRRLLVTWQPRDQADVWVMSAGGRGPLR